MKRAVFLISMVAMFLFSTTSCTTDQYDVEQENTTSYNQSTEINTTAERQDSTNPIVIPKRD